MANEQNLRKPYSSKEAREYGRKGGLVVTDRQRAAAKWREYKKRLKRGNIDSDNPQWLMDRIEDDKSFAVDVLKDIDKLAKQPSYPLDKLIFLKNQIYKSLHGTKLSGEFKDQHDVRVIQYTITDSNDKYPRLEPKED